MVTTNPNDPIDPLWSFIGRRFEKMDGRTVETMPEQIGKFRLIRELGAGGMGVVYEALQFEPARSVAIKLVRIANSEHRLRDRLKREVDILAKLGHDGIVRIIEADTYGHQPYFVMEYVRNQSLLEYCTKGIGDAGPLPVDERVHLFIKLCGAVQYAHSQKPPIIHCDLKPSNILIDSSNQQPKIVDFGIAQFVGEIEGFPKITQEGMAPGTRPYMCPERVPEYVRSNDPSFKPHPKWDVYSLGVVLYELLAGRPPFDFSKCPDSVAFARIRSEMPLKLKSLNNSLDTKLETIVEVAMHKDPNRRYASAAAMAEDLQRYLRGEPLLAHKDPAIYKLQHHLNRFKAVAIVSIAALITVAVFLGYALYEANIADARRREGEAMYRVLVSLRPENPDDPAQPKPDSSKTLEETKSLLKSTTDKPRMAGFLHDVGHILDVRGEIKPALDILQLAVGLRRELAAELRLPADEKKARDLALADALNRLAWCRVHTGDAGGAIPEAAECLKLRSLYLPAAPFPADDILAALSDLARMEMLAGQKQKGMDDFVAVLAMVYEENPADFRKHLESTVAIVGTLALTDSGKETGRKILRDFIGPFIDPKRPRLRIRTPWTLAQFAEFLHGQYAKDQSPLKRPIIDSAAKLLAAESHTLAIEILPAGHSDIKRTDDLNKRLQDEIKSLISLPKFNASRPSSASGQN